MEVLNLKCHALMLSNTRTLFSDIVHETAPGHAGVALDDVVHALQAPVVVRAGFWPGVEANGMRGHLRLRRD
ncbi:MAG: hypothetical protein ACKVIH_08860 [Burkholderiales bacterium]